MNTREFVYVGYTVNAIAIRFLKCERISVAIFGVSNIVPSLIKVLLSIEMLLDSFRRP